MRHPSSLYASLAVVGLLAVLTETSGTQAPPASSPQVSQTPAPAAQPAGRGQGRRGGGGAGGDVGDQGAAGRGRGRGGAVTPPWAILRAPAGVKEGATWIPELPTMADIQPPAGWKPDGIETPWMPATLLRLPRTNITRAKYPAIDFHNHTGSLTTPAQYDAVIKILDQVGVGAVVNLNGGTADQLDAVLKAG